MRQRQMGMLWSAIIGKPAATPLVDTDDFWKNGNAVVTLTGVNSVVQGTAYWVMAGGIVSVNMPSLSGTSNSTSATVTGLPSIIWPVRQQVQYGAITNAGVTAMSRFTIETDGTITLTGGLLGGLLSALLGKGIAAQTFQYSIM